MKKCKKNENNWKTTGKIAGWECKTCEKFFDGQEKTVELQRFFSEFVILSMSPVRRATRMVE